MQNSTDGTNSPDHNTLFEAPQPSLGLLDRVRKAPATTAAVGATILSIAAVTTAMAGPVQSPPAPAGAPDPPAAAAPVAMPPAAAQPLAAPKHSALPPQQAGPQQAGKAPSALAPNQEDQKRTKIIEAAQKEIGTLESGKDCQPYSPQCVSWCALFAMSMWQKAGVDVDPEKYAFTGNVFTTGQQKGTAFDKEYLHDVKPGDVLLFGSSPSNAQTSEHIGIVEKVDGDTVTTIEGNSGSNADRVARDQHQLSPDTFYGGVHPW